MTVVKTIRNIICLKNISGSLADNFQSKKEHTRRVENIHLKNHEGQGSGFEFLGGVSMGTAKFIIDKEVSQDHFEKYDMSGLENKGQYYLAKNVDQSGKVTDSVLIDKQSRTIHFQKNKHK